jgi:hypothetical protein
MTKKKVLSDMRNHHILALQFEAIKRAQYFPPDQEISNTIFNLIQITNEPYIFKAAIDVLKSHDRQSAIKICKDLTVSKNPLKRKLAFSGLAKIPNNDCVEEVNEGLKDKFGAVRLSAARAIASVSEDNNLHELMKQYLLDNSYLFLQEATSAICDAIRWRIKLSMQNLLYLVVKMLYPFFETIRERRLDEKV